MVNLEEGYRVLREGYMPNYVEKKTCAVKECCHRKVEGIIFCNYHSKVWEDVWHYFYETCGIDYRAAVCIVLEARTYKEFRRLLMLKKLEQ